MLVNETELNSRLNNPLNLINRLSSASQSNKNKAAMSLFIPSASPKIKIVQLSTPVTIPTLTSTDNRSEAPTTEELVKDSEDKIKLAIAHDDALSLLQSSIESLRLKIDDVKPEKLPAVISAASKVVESIRSERLERERKGDNENIHFHFYVPAQRQIADYEIINVTER